MDPVKRVRSAGVGGRAVVDALAAAFADDPWLRWALPDPSAVRTLMSLFLRVVAGPHGEVLVVDGGGADRGGEAVVAGVAILMPPDVEAALDPEVGTLVLQLHGRHAGRALDADAVLDRHRPAPSSWVLHTLGVRPTYQRQGVGAALLQECLQRADGSPLVVETSSVAARDFYLGRGFALTDEVRLAEGHGLGADAPTVWMLRHTP